MTAGYRLKRRRGFFAAGAEFARALGVLGDGAFKLFAHVCLEADRATGRLAFDRGELADRLGKSRSALGRHLRELVRAGVCELETAPNQHRHSVLAVRAEYWPYRATEVGVTAPPDPGPTTYVEAVRRAFLGPVCVQADFGPADERLAAGWQARGVPLETVQHAILLGCARKSLALIERPAMQPVRRLRYFEPLLREVQHERFPATYWRHLEFNLARCEDYWQHHPEAAPGRAWPKMEQASQTADPISASPVVGGEARKDEMMMPTSSRSDRDPIDGGAIELSS